MTAYYLCRRIFPTIIAHLLDRTDGALRFSRRTVVSPEEHEWMVRNKLLFISELLFENLVGLLGRFSFDNSYTIHNPVHMGIDSDIRRIIENREHDFRCLDPDSRQRLYGF